MNMPLTFDDRLDARIADLDEKITQAKLYLKKLKAYRRHLTKIQSELVAIAEIEANMPPAPPSNDFVADMEKLANGEAAIDKLMDKYRDNADNHAAGDNDTATNGLVADLEQAIAENRRNYAELLSITTDLASTLAHQYDTEGDVPEPTEATDTPVTQAVREAFEASNQNYCNLLNLSTELAETATELATAEVRRLAPSGEVIDVEVDVYPQSTNAEQADTDLLSQYQSMGIRALRLLCRDKGIKGAARFTKAQCIAALLDN